MYAARELDRAACSRAASRRAGRDTCSTAASPHYNVYECTDGGWISIGSLEPHFFANLCKAMELRAVHPAPVRRSKRDEIKAHFTKSFKTKSRDEWFQILSETDICAAPVYSLREALDDPHNRARGMVVEVDHPTLGKIRTSASARSCQRRRAQVRTTAPPPGQHTDDVLSSIGYDAAAISGLRERGVVA